VQLLLASSLRCIPSTRSHLVKAPLPPVIQTVPHALADGALADVQGARAGFKAYALGATGAIGVGVAVVAADDRNGNSSQGYYGPGF
jgi:hypothetical protein